MGRGDLSLCNTMALSAVQCYASTCCTVSTVVEGLQGSWELHALNGKGLCRTYGRLCLTTCMKTVCTYVQHCWGRLYIQGRTHAGEGTRQCQACMHAYIHTVHAQSVGPFPNVTFMEKTDCRNACSSKAKRHYLSCSPVTSTSAMRSSSAAFFCIVCPIPSMSLCPPHVNVMLCYKMQVNATTTKKGKTHN